MVTRCFNGECVNHSEECMCKVCANAKALESDLAVVSEQGMFGDLQGQFDIDDPTNVKIN